MHSIDGPVANEKNKLYCVTQRINKLLTTEGEEIDGVLPTQLDTDRSIIYII